MENKESKSNFGKYNINLSILLNYLLRTTVEFLIVAPTRANEPSKKIYKKLTGLEYEPSITHTAFTIVTAFWVTAGVILGFSVWFLNRDNNKAQHPQETKENNNNDELPQVELNKRGLSWKFDNFFSAVRDKDRDDIILFLRGGMKLKCNLNRNNECDNMEYAEAKYAFDAAEDEKVADAFIKYNGIDARLCFIPPDAVYSANSIENISILAEWYLTDNESKLRFLRKLCGTDENKKIILDRLVKLKATPIKQISEGIGNGYVKPFLDGTHLWDKVISELFLSK